MKRISAEDLCAAFDYDPRTGLVTNSARQTSFVRGLHGSGSKKKEHMINDPSTGWAGMPAELDRGKGKYEVKFRGRWLPAHRVAWALHYGEYPDFLIDHINRDPLDNRIDNLRKATPAENSRNRTKADNKSSKYLGVCEVKGKWHASIQHAGISTRLGVFENERAAALAYDAAAITFHREFANPNIIDNPYLTGAGCGATPDIDNCAL